MEFSAKKLMIVAAAAILTFALVAGLALRMLPSPRKDSDYLVAGALATAAALAVCFAAVFTDPKVRGTFVKRRNPDDK